MKKMIVTLAGISDYKGNFSENGYSLKNIGSRRYAISSELGGMQTGIIIPATGLYHRTADFMEKEVNVKSVYRTLPDERLLRKLNEDVERLLMPEFERIASVIDGIRDENEALLMISPEMLANSFPSYYARKNGFGECFIPWMSDDGIAVLDFETGRTYQFLV